MKVAVAHPHRTRKGLSDVTILETPQVPTYDDYIFLPGWDQRLRVTSVAYHFTPDEIHVPEQCETGEDPLILIQTRAW